ncbi:MAG: chloride channel protein, partial [Myxococcota bacterium]
SQLLQRGGHLYMVVAAVVVGLAGALGAVAFRVMIRAVQAVAFGGTEGVQDFLAVGWLAEPEDPIHWARELSWYWKIAIPALGGLMVGPLIWFFAREARGHGVPEVMKAVALRGGVIRGRVAAIKAFASALSIGTGGSVGREGPIIQIGSAVGSRLGQLLGLNSAGIRTLVGCGAAAGIAATFNAPIAGAIFAAEIIVGHFAVTQFTPIVISSVVATVLSRVLLGNYPAFHVPEYQIVNPFELLPYLATGVVAGLVAVAFIRTLGTAEKTFERVRMPEYLKACLGGALVGVIALQLPEVYGVGYTTITLALAGTLSALTMAALVGAKIVATSITIGSGGSGGVFAPSLFLGAMSGGVVGTLVERYFPGATASSGAYALVTMGAVVAATTHAPISAIIIIFELTQTIDIIPALMTACVVSSLISQLLERDSIYTSKLRRQGIDLDKTEDPNVLRSLYVRDVFNPEPEVLPESASFKTLLDLVVRSDHSQFFVITSSGELLGAISMSEVRRYIYEMETLQNLVVARDLVEERIPTLKLTDDLDLVMRILTASPLAELPVVDAAQPTQLIGTVLERDILAAAQNEQTRRDLAGGFSSSMSAVDRYRPVDLGDGYWLREMLVPPYMFGRSLSELQIRHRTGAQVLLVRSGAQSPGQQTSVRVPGATERLEEG